MNLKKWRRSARVQKLFGVLDEPINRRRDEMARQAGVAMAAVELNHIADLHGHLFRNGCHEGGTVRVGVDLHAL